jgi:hypothetical protein
MPRGRQPDGEIALRSAERQARYRARRQSLQPPAAIPRHPPTDRFSRPRRWHAAVAELLALQAEYATWSDALPNSLRDSATATALQEIVDLDLEALAVILPPRGYGAKPAYLFDRQACFPVPTWRRRSHNAQRWGLGGAEPPGATPSAPFRASMARMASTGPSPK